jgi:hypothetical protein
MADEKSEEQPWTYTHVHGGDHPDHKDPLTIVAEASDEAIEKEEAARNAAYANAKEKESSPAGATPPEGQAAAAASQSNLDEKTVAELKEIAAEKGIHIPSDANKAEIIKAIKKG